MSENPLPGPLWVVVPTYRGVDRLRACLESLAAQDVPDLTVLVVDNASSDGSGSLLAELADGLSVRIEIARQERNLGFAGGVNVGIARARAAGAWAVALFNDDAIAGPGWLVALAWALAGHSGTGIVTGRLLLGDGEQIDSTGEQFSIWGLSFPRDRGEPASLVRDAGEVFGATGGASLYRVEMLEMIGDLDERFGAYYEDADLSFRARLAGWQVWHVPQAIARHHQGATSATMPGFLVRQTFANIPLLVVKNVPGGLLPRVAGRLVLLYPLMIANAIRKGSGRAALTGAVRAIRLIAVHGLRERRRIQRAATVSGADLRAVMWPDLPPGQTGMRKLRALLGRGSGRHPVGPVQDSAGSTVQT